MNRTSLLIAFMVGAFLCSPAFGQLDKPADAAVLYIKAAKQVADNVNVNVMAPAASNMTYPAYPPFSAEWMDMEETDFDLNVPARALAHRARDSDHADWPPRKEPNSVMYLNHCRGLANELGDAALYQHVQGNDAAAVETFLDLLHFADLLKNQPNKTLIRELVGYGIKALAMDRLQVITAGVTLTRDPTDHDDVQVAVATALVARLATRQDAESDMKTILQDEGTPVNSVTRQAIDRCTITFKRVNVESELAALSLACHLYRLDTGHWPASLDDLHKYLPAIPVDPFGDGRQTLGYVLIKAGLPDGSDRPLVYSRERSEDGLFIRTERPFYSFYNNDDFAAPKDREKQGGQFRDVASWVPKESSRAKDGALVATTQPLP